MLATQLRFIKQHQRGISALLMLLAIGIVAVLLHCWDLEPLPFKKFSFQEGDILKLVMSLSVMAIFMERAVEAILIPVRTPDRQQIEHEIDTLRAELALNADPALQRRLKKKDHELETYRLHTARYAYWLSFVLGMAISLVGVRALGGLIDLEVLHQLSSAQQTFFALVDIVITGGVIAGGSAAIDKMGRRISKSLDLTSATSSTITKKAKPPQGSEPSGENPVNPAAN